MQKDIVYAFIDSQNLNLSIKNSITKNGKVVYKGWNLDFKKFRKYLFDKFKVSKAYIFIGKVDGNDKLYNNLTSCGFNLIFKPTIEAKSGTKGNVDAELVLYSAKILYNDFTKAVFVSGDGDFYCLYKEFKKENKLLKIVIPNKKSESKLLKDFQKDKVFLEYEREKLTYKK